MGFIKPKYGHCEECSKYSILVAKKCQYCYPKFRAKVVSERNLRREENKPADLKLVANDGKKLLEWFERQVPKLNNRCLECGEETEVWMREKTGMQNKPHFAIAHILPKNVFKSISTCDHNWLELCQKHHTEFDSSIERASKMKCFAIAVEHFKKFEHLIKENHKHLDLFREYADKVKK